MNVLDIAKAFHNSYEMFAPAVGWADRAPGTEGVAWEDLPEANRLLMVVVITDLKNRGIIR